MVELRLHCPQHAVEPISDALLALDALSVSVEDADAHTEAEQALFGEPGMPPPKEGWQRSRVIALFATEELAQLIVAQGIVESPAEASTLAELANGSLQRARDLADGELRRRMGGAGRELCAAHRGATQAHLRACRELLDGSTPRSPGGP